MWVVSLALPIAVIAIASFVAFAMIWSVAKVETGRVPGLGMGVDYGRESGAGER